METLTADDRLFTFASDTKANACIDPYVDLTRLARYYKEAGDELAGMVAADNQKLDCYIYPITYLYRMHIELLLKMIIHAGRRVADGSGGFERIHDIRKLWCEAKDHAIPHLPGEPPEWVPHIDHVIDEFMKVDPYSTSFRYGGQQLKDIRHINVRNLKQVVERLGHSLAQIADPLHHAWEQLGN